MFVLTAQSTNGAVYYNGKAGPAWVSANKAEAFQYTKGEAERKAEQFNRMSALHGLTFTIEAV